MMRFGWAILCGLLLPGPLCAEPPTDVRATLSDWRESKDGRAGKEGWTRRNRLVTFDLGPISYGVQYDGSRAPDAPVDDPGEGPIGLARPYTEGWYGGGFLHLAADGKSLDPLPLSFFEIVENDGRAVAQMVFHDDQTAVRARFLGLPRDDRLFVELTVEAATPIEKLTLRLQAFPSFFTSANQRVGARRTQTAAGVVVENEAQTLAGDGGWWAVLYDEVFDPARGEGRGPCAMATDPDALASVRVDPRAYASGMTLTLKPGVTRLPLAFWEFPGQENAAVLARFPAAADEALAALRTLDFTPAVLKNFQPGDAEQELQQARTVPTLVQEFGPRIDEAVGWLQAARALQAAAVPGIRDEETFLTGYRQQTSLLWELRLATLLAGL